MFQLWIVTSLLHITGGSSYHFETAEKCTAAGKIIVEEYRRDGMEISFECEKEERTTS